MKQFFILWFNNKNLFMSSQGRVKLPHEPTTPKHMENMIKNWLINFTWDDDWRHLSNTRTDMSPHCEICTRPKPIYFDSISFQYEILVWSSHARSSSKIKWLHCVSTNQISRVTTSETWNLHHNKRNSTNFDWIKFYSQVINRRNKCSYFHGNFSVVVIEFLVKSNLLTMKPRQMNFSWKKFLFQLSWGKNDFRCLIEQSVKIFLQFSKSSANFSIFHFFYAFTIFFTVE